MIRPLIYHCTTKLTVSLALCLVWNRWFNQKHHYGLVESAFFVAAVLFFMLAWFQYLRLDGVSISLPRKKKEGKKKHITRDIVDFADEKIISFAELEEDERTVCRLLGNLICGACYLIPSLIALRL